MQQSITLEEKSLSKLRGRKNLLAFSGGADSTALFFLLLKHDIDFDIAIVDYGIREQSKQEVAYAMELAKTHHLKCFVHNAPKIEKNFEARAREIRYAFFEELIQKHCYKNLLSAHHLGDRFEWLLMQFCKGAGCVELAGMQVVQKRESYNVVRPLLHLDKQELLRYLRANEKLYFEDETNLDEDIKRNSFRHNYSLPLLEKYLQGIKKSFEYIDDDRDSLLNQAIEIKKIDSFAYFKTINNKRAEIFVIDKYLKSQGYMLSFSEREALRDEKTLQVGRKFIVNQDDRGFVFIAPYIKETGVMPSDFKEECRLLKIEPKLRYYLYTHQDIFLVLKELLGSMAV